MSVRFADKTDAVAGAGLEFSDIVTQSVTATASASVMFQNAVDDYESSRSYIVAFGEDGDSDRVPDDRDQCPGTAFEADIDPNGCAQSQVDQDFDGVCDAGASSSRWCTGSDSCPNTPLGTVVDGSGCSVGIPVDSDGDGVSDSSDSCPNTPPNTAVGTNGCPITAPTDTDADGVPDTSDNCRNDYNPSQADSDGDGLGYPCDSGPRLRRIDLPQGMLWERRAYKISFFFDNAENLTCDSLPIVERASYESISGQLLSSAGPNQTEYSRLRGTDIATVECRALAEPGAFEIQFNHDWDWIPEQTPDYNDLLDVLIVLVQATGVEIDSFAKVLDLVRDWFSTELAILDTLLQAFPLARYSYDVVLSEVEKGDYVVSPLAVNVSLSKRRLHQTYAVTSIACFVLPHLLPGGTLASIATAVPCKGSTWLLYDAAWDPDFDYKRIADPTIGVPDGIRLIPDESEREVGTRFVRFFGFARAIQQSLARYEAAVERGDDAWVFAQVKAAEYFMQQLAQQAQLVATSIRTLGTTALPLDPNEVGAFQAQLQTAGFPLSVIELAMALGVSTERLDQLRRELTQFRPSLLGVSEQDLDKLLELFVEATEEQLVALRAEIPVVTPADGDEDGIADSIDNCPARSNLLQTDRDGDGVGTACDVDPPVTGCDDYDGLWRASNVDLRCAAFDRDAGLSDAGDSAFVLATTIPAGDETADARTNTRTICDANGNCATAGPIAGIKIDRKAPAVTIGVPVAIVYAFGQAIAAVYTCTDGGAGVATCAGPVASSANIDTSSLGSKTFTVNASDNVGNTSSLSVNYTVVAAPTSSAVTVSPTTQQYSDTVTLTATLTHPTLGGQVPASSVTFMIGSQAVGTAPLTVSSGSLQASLTNVRLREPLPFGTAPTGQMSPGTHTVTAVFGGVNSNFIVTNPTTTLTIAKEDARATYTGALFASTACVTCPTATVTLSATIQDISAVAGDPATDATEGDIRHATATFQIVETGQVITGIPIGLVNASDTRTGTATTNTTVNLGTANAMAFTVRVTVDGYYTSPVEQTIVTVAKPLSSSFIAGGGYLLMTQSAGQYAGQPGSKNNVGFSVKYNKSGTNLQGNVNLLVRNNGRIYQIKGNAITSLSTSPATGTATLNGKANIQDVTNPANPVSIDGNATLQLTMTDKGTPGTADTLGVTVWNKSGGLWFSSSWSGTQTVEQALGGGNVVVR